MKANGVAGFAASPYSTCDVEAALQVSHLTM
jgi:hypothetical protein